MSWSGYIPGHIVREMIEREERELFAEVDKSQLEEELVGIINEEVIAYSDCGCGSWLEYERDAAKRIIEKVQRILNPEEV